MFWVLLSSTMDKRRRGSGGDNIDDDDDDDDLASAGEEEEAFRTVSDSFLSLFHMLLGEFDGSWFQSSSNISLERFAVVLFIAYSECCIDQSGKK